MVQVFVALFLLGVVVACIKKMFKVAFTIAGLGILIYIGSMYLI